MKSIGALADDVAAIGCKDDVGELIYKRLQKNGVLASSDLQVAPS